MNHRYTIVAHRCGKGYGVENSLEALKACLDHQPDMVEIDVRMTRDGKFIVFHDPVLDRLTDWSGLVNTKTLKMIQKVRLKNGSRIPTVDEAFRLIQKLPKTGLIIDIKDLNTGVFNYKKLIAKIKKHGLERRVIIFCMNYHLLRRIARDYPLLTYCYFSLLPRRKTLLRAKKIGARYVGALMLTKQFIRKAHQKDMKVVSLGTEKRKKLLWHIRNRVDIISTGHPSVIRELIANQEKEKRSFMQRISDWLIE